MEVKNFLQEFGQHLKKVRRAKGLSQVKAAQEMKIDYRHYQNIEGGKINLRLDTFVKLIEFYGLGSYSKTLSLEDLVSIVTQGPSKTAAMKESLKQLPQWPHVGREGKVPMVVHLKSESGEEIPYLLVPKEILDVHSQQESDFRILTPGAANENISGNTSDSHSFMRNI